MRLPYCGSRLVLLLAVDALCPHWTRAGSSGPFSPDGVTSVGTHSRGAYVLHTHDPATRPHDRIGLLSALAGAVLSQPHCTAIVSPQRATHMRSEPPRISEPAVGSFAKSMAAAWQGSRLAKCDLSVSVDCNAVPITIQCRQSTNTADLTSVFPL